MSTFLVRWVVVPGAGLLWPWVWTLPAPPTAGGGAPSPSGNTCNVPTPEAQPLGMSQPQSSVCSNPALGLSPSLTQILAIWGISHWFLLVS